MNVELTAEEAEALAGALRVYISDLRMEIVDTERLAMRSKLKVEEELLASILARLAPDSTSAAWPFEPPPDVDVDTEGEGAR